MVTERPSLPWLRALALALLLSLGAPPAHAATIIARSDAELAQRSDAVVVATVEQVAFELGPDGAVRTRNTLVVENWWKGHGPARLDVLQAGGEWRGMTTRLDGDFALAPGQRVVMFLRRGPEAFHSTLLSWSVYDIHGQGIGARVERQGKDLAAKRRGPDGLLHDIDPRRRPSARSLGGLKADVLTLARKGAQR